MSGTIKGGLKSKLGLRGATKPGDMIQKMNDMKYGAASGMGRKEKAKKVTKKIIKKTI